MKLTLKEEKIFNLLKKTKSDTPELAGRASAIFPKYVGLNKKGIFNFRTNSQSRPGYYWYQTVEIKNMPALASLSEEITPDLIKKWFEIADVNLFCSDESYLYYAFQYMGTQRDYNDPAQPENRAPKRNNTKLKGGLCKHLTSIIQHIENGDYYEQMAKDVMNWRNYTSGATYKSFSRGRNMGQVNKREKEIDWRKFDSFMDNTLWAKHNVAKFLRQYNIKKSIEDEIKRQEATGEEVTTEQFLDDNFAMTTAELAREAGVEEKDINDWFKQSFGIDPD